MLYVEYVYEILKAEGLDTVYEDYIIRTVGTTGLTELRKEGLLEACGVINGRQLYVLA